MRDIVVPVVCAVLWLGTWCLGFLFYRFGSQFLRNLTVQPEGWPLSNLASFITEFLAYAASMIAFLRVSHYDFDHIRGVSAANICVYSLLLLFLFVYSYELYRNVGRLRKRLYFTLTVIISYVVTQVALVVYYAIYLEEHQDPLPLVLGLFVLVQKILDVYWAYLRIKGLSSN